MLIQIHKNEKPIKNLLSGHGQKWMWPVWSRDSKICCILNPVSASFCQIFIFSPNGSTSKAIKNIFYFIEKALFILKLLIFSLSTLSRFKRTNRSGIVYDAMNWLA